MDWIVITMLVFTAPLWIIGLFMVVMWVGLILALTATLWGALMYGCYEIISGKKNIK